MPNYQSSDENRRQDRPRRTSQESMAQTRDVRSNGNGSYPRRKSTDGQSRSSQPPRRRPQRQPETDTRRRREGDGRTDRSRRDGSRPRPQRADGGGSRREPAGRSGGASRGRGPTGDRATLIKIIIAIVIAAIVLILVFKGCSGCAANDTQSAAPADNAQAAAPAADGSDGQGQEGTGEGTGVQPTDFAMPDRDLLADLIGAELADQLLAEAATNDDLYWIASHPDLFEPEDAYLQGKLIRLATVDPAARDFVRHYPEARPAETAVGPKGSAIPNDTRVPHLYQWDQRWGYTTYCSTGFGLTGCNPTAMAMVYQGLTGKNDVSPYDMGQLAQELGYMDEFAGTPYTFLYAAAEHFGISCWAIDGDVDSIRENLQAGNIVVENVGTGYFSRGNGHYIVLTGVDSAGNIIINDPYSAVNSAQSFDPEFLIGEAKGFYAFSL